MSYYVPTKAAPFADRYMKRRERVEDTLRDLAVPYYRRGRWRGPIPRSWRRVKPRP